MSLRTIPIALADAMAEPTTHDCRLWKIRPRLGGAVFGLTSLDVDVPFDDGSADGEVTYKAFRGYAPYAIESTADLSVDNSEMEVLIAEYEVDGFTSEAIDRGVYDDARFIEYLVDYTDLSKGKAITNSGTVGRIVKVDNMVCFPETRSLTQTLKQKSIIELGSNSCRATQGDERCGVDVEALFVATTITEVGVETDRVFVVAGVGVSTQDSFYAPGLYRFAVGANAGKSFEIESYDGTTQTVTLLRPTPAPITTDDTGEIRDNCTNLWAGYHSCDYYGARLNFRGEAFRPVSDTSNLMAAGAGSNNTGQNTPPAAEA
ncbi:DUF2163 domain-containing protein [Pseudoxanthomonas sacheonensis]|uniref:DUF2163 domain-containing protein n=1 Tax=Pseudoxanthomonas sacheonensis TaxID=443615 RepID=UPI0013D7EEB2|nr:DUF2163 domain-containing protein [Pseudoxanthomonas sacheonensis]KAF1706295.1 hypothetical protein CSC73_16455 [Pseudoxanthomonas sacheonensis]